MNSDSTVDNSSSLLIGADSLRLLNVTRSQIFVLQCNVSNKHGYLYANAYLNVLGNSVLYLRYSNKTISSQNCLTTSLPLLFLCTTASKSYFSQAYLLLHNWRFSTSKNIITPFLYDLPDPCWHTEA